MSILAYSNTSPQPGMVYNYYKNDHDRFTSAWHASHCTTEDCEYCNLLCDSGLIISCDECGNVHHTDWLGWSGTVDLEGKCIVLCPECVKSLQQ